MQDVERLHVDISTNARSRPTPSAASGRLGGDNPLQFTLRPRWGGLNPKDLIEQRTISDSGRAQHSS